MTKCIAFIALLGGLILAGNVNAQVDNFPPSDDESLSFGSDEKRPIVSGRSLDEDRSSDDETKSGFPWLSLPKPKLPTLPKPSLPKLSLPSWGTSTTTTTASKARMNEEPSAWEKFNSGTKSLYTKTKHTLMPWTSDEEPSRSKSSPSHRTARSKSSKSKTDKKPFFSSWLGPKPEEKQIKTVNDYLALPRVPYD